MKAAAFLTGSDPLKDYSIEELAKWYEHRIRNIGLATAIVQQILVGEKSLNEPERQSLTHRLRRLLHKAGAP